MFRLLSKIIIFYHFFFGSKLFPLSSKMVYAQYFLFDLYIKKGISVTAQGEEEPKFKILFLPVLLFSIKSRLKQGLKNIQENDYKNFPVSLTINLLPCVCI